MSEGQHNELVGSDKPPYPKQTSSKQRPAYALLDPTSEEYRCISAEIVVYDDMIEDEKTRKRKLTGQDFKDAAKRLKEDYNVKLHFNGVRGCLRIVAHKLLNEHRRSTAHS